MDDTDAPRVSAEPGLSADGRNGSRSSLPGASGGSDNALNTREPGLIYWEDLPAWQRHWWSRERRDVPTRLPSPLLPNPVPVAPQPVESEGEADLSSSSDSDSDIEDPLGVTSSSESTKKKRFPVDIKLNEKIGLFIGNITIMRVDALVNPTPITSSNKAGVGGRILAAGGSELSKHLSSLERPRTGEARATPGYGTSSKLILHTIGPRYSDQYLTAAESALYSCYRSVVDHCVEHRLSTLAVPPIHSLHRQFPTLLGAHITLRTLRYLLQTHADAFDRIIIVFDPTDEENPDIYYSVMKLYFPRNAEEEHEARDHIPLFHCNQFGEPFVEERQVRIGASFVSGRLIGFGEGPNVPSANGARKQAESSGSLGSFGATSSSALDDGLRSTRDNDSFPASMRSMSAYRDDERRKTSRTGIGSLYEQYLAEAHMTDLSRIAGLGLFYMCGTDALERPVIGIIGNRLPDSSLHHLVFLQYIKFMDNYANAPYVIVYLHTGVSQKSKPSIAWLQKVYGVMDAKYGQSLAAIHVLHPTFWLKLAEKLASVFMSSTAILDKITYHDSLVELRQGLGFLPRLPRDVIEADAAENGPLPNSSIGRTQQQR